MNRNIEMLAVMPPSILVIGAFIMIIGYILIPSRKAGTAGSAESDYSVFSGAFPSSFRAAVYLFSLVFALIFSLYQADKNKLAFTGSLYVDSFSAFYSVLLLISAIFCAFLSFGELEKQDVKPSLELDVLQLFAIAGGLIMMNAANLPLLFVGFELLSVCVYALCGAALKRKASAESSLKYFMLGAFSSAFLLYGMALVYGATGSIYYSEIASASSPDNMLLLLGIGFILFGFAFKLSLAPFHIWTPDVYQGAPSSFTAFMAVVVKVAAFGAFLRLFLYAFQDVSQLWLTMIWMLSILSMSVGNIMAIQQKSIKRMLAYSSIAHGGYLLLGFLILSYAGLGNASTYYLVAYVFMSIASFGCVVIASGNTKHQYENDSIESFSGLGFRSPALALCMTISMFALAGMPPFMGFLGKYYLFTSAVQSGFTGLVIVAAINSAISLYYYLRVIVFMYFKEDVVDSQSVDRCSKSTFFPSLAIYGATLLVIVMGIYSEPLYLAVQSVFP
ncbi:MAG TPA: NADH-quinone oxidoreductase subunit N [Oligoflexia bacterium]|nr:NADH-quinone oxidoreductase subunit N [Oligoflexia bacterium]HMP47896.1 NADH-quinone oxidoreductase subunit N [Oligoflexia bacterium]